MTGVRHLDTETINTMIETQLALWPEATKNFALIRGIRRKPITLGKLEAHVQCNPARIRSTGANTDAQAISQRPCFLCSTNRPQQQVAVEWVPGWELLINPYPILPVHFTIVKTEHVPQARIPLDMATMAEAAPTLAFFFNGAKAGASAPDHLHVQAVLKDELPLIRYIDANLNADESILEEGLPFKVYATVITPDNAGMQRLAKIPTLCGVDAETGNPDPGLANAFFWMGVDGMLRVAVVPRKRHRPLCYGNEPENYLVSPGALDMAGIMVTPRLEDFERMDEAKMREIYSDVAL